MHREPHGRPARHAPDHSDKNPIHRERHGQPAPHNTTHTQTSDKNPMHRENRPGDTATPQHRHAPKPGTNTPCTVRQPLQPPRPSRL